MAQVTAASSKSRLDIYREKATSAPDMALETGPAQLSFLIFSHFTCLTWSHHLVGRISKNSVLEFKLSICVEVKPILKSQWVELF